MRKGWFDALAQAYSEGGKPFAGQLLGQDSKNRLQTTGVGIYPPDVRKFSTNPFLARSNPFDSVMAMDIGGRTSSLSGVIGHYLKPIGRSSFFATKENTAALIASRYVLYHGSSDGSLARAICDGVFGSPPAESKVSATFYHSGDLGDIIYSLLFIQSKFDSCDLYIGPDPSVKVRDPMTRTKFNWIAPLLEKQPFIKRVIYCDHPPRVDYNLNDFRDTWFSKQFWSTPGRALFQAYATQFKVDPLPEDKPWLIADPHINPMRPVVIARSSRYRNPKFPWKAVAEQYSGQMVFVGHQSEYQQWASEFGNAAKFHPVHDALEMSRYIAGAKLFIGNQSFPMSLALGLNTPVIQESWPERPDCIFDRKNAQFTHKSTSVVLPKIEAVNEYALKTTPNDDGVIELGPMAGGPGIGDTLMIQPLAKALGKRAVMLLPNSMANYSFFFRNACQVRLSNNYPAYHYEPGVLQSKHLLKRFGYPQANPIPEVALSEASLAEAKKLLAYYGSLIGFCPTCSRVWAHARQRPPEFWKPIITYLSKRHTILQFGREDYPTLDGAVRMPFVDIETLSACYKVAGVYVGVNTGDYHLAAAVGAKVVVANQDPWGETKAWSYECPSRIQFGVLSDPNSVISAAKKLGL